MSTFDIIILVLLALGGIAGFQKGLITGVAKLIGKIAAIGIAFVFNRQFLGLIENIVEVREMVEPRVGNFLARVLEVRIAEGAYGNSNALIEPVLGQATTAMTNYVLKIGSIIILFILAVFIINLIIAVVITPLAKSLSFVNRGGGLAFGVLSSGIVLCLIVGLLNPFLSTAGPGALEVNQSLLFSWMVGIYKLLISFISGFSGDVLSNPLDALPVFKETSL